MKVRDVYRTRTLVRVAYILKKFPFSARRAMTPRGQRPEEVDERQLFHGTPTLQAARGICANSFDFRRSGENVGAIHGKGAYFSTTARFSHKYTRAHTPVTGAVTALAVGGAPRSPGQVSYAGPPGAESRSCKVCRLTVSQESPIVGPHSGAEPGAVVPFRTPKRPLCTDGPLRFMFLGRILVGQYTLGHPSYTKPPERDRLKLYDSCVNDVFNPTVFVIFDLAQSYPEYLIQYTDLADSTQQRAVTQGSRDCRSPSSGQRPRAMTPGPRGRCSPSPRAMTPGSRGRCSPSPVRRPRAVTQGSRDCRSPSSVQRPRAATPGPRGPRSPSSLASVSVTTVQSYSSTVQTPIKSIKTPSTPSPTANPAAPLAPRAETQVSRGPPSPSSLASVSATTVQSYSSNVQTQIKSIKAPSFPLLTANPSAPIAPRAVTQSVVSLSSTTLQSSPPDVRVSNNPLFSSWSLSAQQLKSSTRKRKKKNKCVIT